MSTRSAHVSAIISAATKEKLDRFTEELGLEQSFVVEQALLYFMESRRELPYEGLIPTRVVLDDDAFDRLLEHIEASAVPAPALRELMRRRRVEIRPLAREDDPSG